MSSQYLASYRSVLRELRKSVRVKPVFFQTSAHDSTLQSITTRDKRNRAISSNIRAIFEDHRKSWQKGAAADVQESQQKLVSAIANSVTYLRSQRVYKVCIRCHTLFAMIELDAFRNCSIDTILYTICLKKIAYMQLQEELAWTCL